VAWWATVYHLWLQRNSRIHGGVIKTEEQIVRDIQKDVKARLDSVIVKTSVLNRTLCNNWKLMLIYIYIYIYIYMRWVQVTPGVTL
jgi:hypothetical protein